MKRQRPSWEEYALGIAYAAKVRSEHPYWQVGACVLRHDHSVAATGYNGALPGMELDWSIREERRKHIIHAEPNCVNRVQPGECGLIAVTTLPCPDCINDIAIKRIPRIVFSEIHETHPERNKESYNKAQLFKIELVHLPLLGQTKKFELSEFDNLPLWGKFLYAFKRHFKMECPV